jgi:hypothetical protein
MLRHTLAFAALCAIAQGATVWADAPVWVTKPIHHVPRTIAEVAAAHAQSNDACAQIPADAPLEIGDFASRIAYDVTPEGKGQQPARSCLYAASRRGALSFGLEMSKADQAKLPLLSSSIIMNHINGTYVSIQVRVHRELPDGQPYLHYRPLAAMGVYGKPLKSTSLEELVEESVANVRGLGLFVKPGQPLSAEALRTLVIANKCTVAKVDAASGSTRLIPYYDLFFVRARVDGDKIALHSFATKDELSKLCYVRPYESPDDSTECGVTSTIYFTKYAYAGQYPTAQAARACRYNSQAEFTMAELDRFAAASGWKGDALDNLTDLLDAIIDGRVKPRGQSEKRGGA